MRGSLFPLFPLFWWPMSIHPVKTWTWTSKIGEIGTLSVFSFGEVPKPWEGPYFPYFPQGWSAKTMKGPLFPLFPLFWWPMSIHPVKKCTTKIGTLSMFSLGEVPKPWEGPYFPYFPLRVKCQNHERVPISPISPIFRAYLFILPRHGPPK